MKELSTEKLRKLSIEKYKWHCQIFAYMVIVTIAVLVSQYAARDAIIVNAGVRPYGIWMKIFWGVLIFNALGLAFNLVRLISANIAQKREQLDRMRKQLDEAQEQALKAPPQDTSLELMETWELLKDLERPLSGSIVMIDDKTIHNLCLDCRARLDAIKQLKIRQDQLLKVNHAQYLQDTLPVLDKIELRICQYIRKIYNRCLAIDNDTENIRNDPVLSEYQKAIREQVASAKRLIAASADLINQHDAKGDADDHDALSEVERWIEVINESLKEEDF